VAPPLRGSRRPLGNALKSSLQVPQVRFLNLGLGVITAPNPPDSDSYCLYTSRGPLSCFAFKSTFTSTRSQS